MADHLSKLSQLDQIAEQAFKEWMDNPSSSQLESAYNEAVNQVNQYCLGVRKAIDDGIDIL